MSTKNTSKKTTEKSKYWSDMFICTENNISNNDHENNNDHDIDGMDDMDNDIDGTNYIISYDEPVGFDHSKMKIVFTNTINRTELNDVSNFYREHNKMVTGNTTLFPPEELSKFLNFENISFLMKSSKNKLIGTIVSLVFPIKVGPNINNVITHGCTTCLAVHKSLRSMGLCMGLIRTLIKRGYESKIYCDYHIVSFKLGSNSVPINSWYRPINLSRCKQLGFKFIGFEEKKKSVKSRLMYRCDEPKNYSMEQISSDKNNVQESLKYHLDQVCQYKFSFWPDIELWLKWVDNYPTYVIRNKENNIECIFSISTIHCCIENMQEDAILCFPLICEGNVKIGLKFMCNVAKKYNYDLLYFHQAGSFTENNLESINSIKTTSTLWFSLYNNSIQLTSPTDIHTPLL